MSAEQTGVMTYVILIVGIFVLLVGGYALWQGFGYGGSSSPSIGPGLGAALAKVVGIVLTVLGLGLSLFGLRRLF